MSAAGNTSWQEASRTTGAWMVSPYQAIPPVGGRTFRRTGTALATASSSRPTNRGGASRQDHRPLHEGADVGETRPGRGPQGPVRERPRPGTARQGRVLRSRRARHAGHREIVGLKIAPPGPTPPSLGAALLFAAGLPVAPVLVSVALGVSPFSAGASLFAVRAHLDSGDRAAAGAPIFVALGIHGVHSWPMTGSVRPGGPAGKRRTRLRAGSLPPDEAGYNRFGYFDRRRRERASGRIGEHV